MLLPVSLEKEQLHRICCPFTIFGPTKLISSSKSAGASPVNFLCFPLNYWHIKSANQPVPLYTDLFLYNSVCHQRLSRRFPLLHSKWPKNMKNAQLPVKTRFLTRSSENWWITASSPFARMRAVFPNKNLGASKSPHNYITF